VCVCVTVCVCVCKCVCMCVCDCVCHVWCWVCCVAMFPVCICLCHTYRVTHTGSHIQGHTYTVTHIRSHICVHMFVTHIQGRLKPYMGIPCPAFTPHRVWPCIHIISVYTICRKKWINSVAIKMWSIYGRPKPAYTVFACIEAGISLTGMADLAFSHTDTKRSGIFKIRCHIHDVPLYIIQWGQPYTGHEPQPIFLKQALAPPHPLFKRPQLIICTHPPRSQLPTCTERTNIQLCFVLDHTGSDKPKPLTAHRTNIQLCFVLDHTGWDTPNPLPPTVQIFNYALFLTSQIQIPRTPHRPPYKYSIMLCSWPHRFRYPKPPTAHRKNI